MSKVEIRNIIKSRIAALDKDVALECSGVAISHLKELLRSRNKSKVLVYSSLNDELCTKLFLTESQNQFEFYLPKVQKDHSMTVHRVEQIETDLEIGSFGILEPITKAIEHWFNEIEVVVVPARAIDYEGNRLGRGRGYYDRLLSIAQNKNILIVGLIYNLQWIEEIQSENHDISLHYVVTEKGSFQIRK